MCAGLWYLVKHFLNERKEAGDRMHTLMTNHIQHLASSQDSFATFQNNTVRIQEQMSNNLNEQRELLKGFRVAMNAGFKDIADRQDVANTRISEIKGKLG
jgi:uncharacterized protein YicC (UPF0701 family)